MRPVELVVRYFEGEPLPDERLEWSGVFLADEDDEVERAFAEAEPPAHDDWIPDNMVKGPRKTFVNVALRQIKATARETGLAPIGQPSGDTDGPPLARVAGVLGAFLDGSHGEGAGKASLGTGSSRKPPRARASRPVFLRLEESSAGPIALFKTVVQQDAKKSGKRLDAMPKLVLDGGASTVAGSHAEQPRVIGIKREDGEVSSDTATLDLLGEEGSFEITVTVPADSAIGVEVSVVEGASE